MLRESSIYHNIVLSPTSILTAMVMLYEGSICDTRDEIAILFEGDPNSSLARESSELLNELAQRKLPGVYRALTMFGGGEPEFKISLANSLWVQQGYALKRDFTNVVRSDLRGEVRTIDMMGDPTSAATEVNQWVDHATNGRISGMISGDTFSQLSRLIVCTSLYLKATWVQTFAQPTPGQFHLLDGATTAAQMMTGGGLGKRYAVNDQYWAVEISYVNEAVAMIVLVPDEPGPDALQSLERQLPKGLQELEYEPLGEFDTLTIPEFSVTTMLETSGSLRGLGIEKLFTRDADLSGISDAGPLWVDHILHGSSIQVDRYGTEAAAATTGVLLAALPPPPTRSLVVDKPFAFAILDRPTDTILFLGRVVDPT